MRILSLSSNRHLFALALGLAFSVPLLLLTSQQAAGQLPRYEVLFPARITSGDFAGDYDLFRAGFSADGLIDGDPMQPKTISSQNFRELDPVTLPDMMGGYYVAYTIEYNDSAHKGDRDILIRHIDFTGANLWGDSVNHVMPVAQSSYIEKNPKLTLLSDGSFIIFYEVWYNSGDVDVAVVRLARDGSTLWTKWAANSNRRELLRGAVPNNLGGALALIEAEVYRDTTLLTSDVLIQHVDTSGRIGWKDSEEPGTVAASPYLERKSTMVSDGHGGAYITYELEYNRGERAGDVDILAQHITYYGSRKWTDETNPPIVSSNAKAKERNPIMVRDSSGIIVAFEVSFPFAKGKGTANVIGMQRLDSTGRTTWNLGRKSKLIGIGDDIAERPQLVADPTAGGAYLIFETLDTATGNRDIYAQRIDSQGDQIWGDGERPVPVFATPEVEENAAIAPDGLGGLVIVAQKHLSSEPVPGYSAIVAHRIALDGVLLWQEMMQAPMTIVSAAYQGGAPVIVRK